MPKKEGIAPSCIVPFSGGVDSTTILYSEPGAIPLVFCDDSEMFREFEYPAIERILQEIGMDDRHIECRFPQTELLEFERQPNGIIGLIPGYKMMMQTVAMAFAHRMGLRRVVFGNSNQNTSYADETDTAVIRFQHTYNSIYGTAIDVELPFWGKDRSEVVKLGYALGVPFKLTQTCANPVNASESVDHGVWIHCGVCKSCIDRRMGFLHAEVYDETWYRERRLLE